MYNLFELTGNLFAIFGEYHEWITPSSEIPRGKPALCGGDSCHLPDHDERRRFFTRSAWRTRGKSNTHSIPRGPHSLSNAVAHSPTDKHRNAPVNPYNHQHVNVSANLHRDADSNELGHPSSIRHAVAIAIPISYRYAHCIPNSHRNAISNQHAAPTASRPATNLLAQFAKRRGDEHRNQRNRLGGNCC